MRVPVALGLIAAIFFLSAPSIEAGQWTQLFPTTAPPARMFAGMAYDEARGRLVLFGGTPTFDRTTFYSDTWEWDGTGWSQVQTPNSPPGRHAMYMAYDTDRNVVVLYGGQHGFGDGSSWGDMWQYDGADWRQITPSATPGPRGEGAMAYDRGRHVMVLYGGHIGGVGDLNDTWEFDGATWRQKAPAASPSLANNEAMTYDVVRSQILLHGGCGNGDRAWLYDGVNWTAGPQGPPSRNGLSIAHHSITGKSVVFGGSVGCGYEVRQDTWEWNGTVWGEVTPAASPSARWGMPMDFVPANGGLVAFGGGFTGAANADTWLYRTDCGSQDLDCDGIANSGDNCPTTPNLDQIDVDQDGFGRACDCNDADPLTYPGAAEICDVRDNDCDGQIDDGIPCQQNCPLPDKIGDDLRVTDAPTDSREPAIVWTGLEFGAVWRDSASTSIHFRRLQSSGEPIGTHFPVSGNGSNSAQPSLVWTGAEYGVAWKDFRDGNDEIYFSRLDPFGVPIGNEVRVTNAPAGSRVPALVWTGTGYGVAWEDNRDGNLEIYFARLDTSGTVIGSELRITHDENQSGFPTLAWTGMEYGLAWHDALGGDPGIYLVRLDSSGSIVGTATRITDVSGNSLFPKLSWSGSEYGLAWTDDRDGNEEIYFARLDPLAVKIGDDVRVTNDPASSLKPSLVWTGKEFGLVWFDLRNGNPLSAAPNWEVYFAHLDRTGAKIGADIRITNDPAGSFEPALAWTGNSYAMVYEDLRDVPYQVYLSRVDCDCVDGDNDGSSRCQDCDESRPDVYPDASEVCDGIDQNCNGLADDGLGQTTCGVGACTRTVENCVAGVPQACIPGSPSAETCDGVDNDCNGMVDDIMEVCNGVDDNCDGQVDEDEVGVDSDGDAVPNACDNCRFAYNPTQVDADRDGPGNACDNCVFLANPSQADLDADQRGDICDNCPAQYNPFQDDFDADAVGDVCDNCHFEPNSDQGDMDSDFEGNVCDLDDGLIWVTLPDAFTVAWQQEIGFESFNIYQGNLAVLKTSGVYTQDPETVALASRACDVTGGVVYYDTDPGPGEVLFFLVSGNAVGVEGSLGTNSAGVERPNTNPCP